MISQIENFLKFMLKRERDLVLDNLVNDLEKKVFELKYAQKMSKNQIRKELKIGANKLDKVLSDLNNKIMRIPELGFKFNINEASEEMIIDRCKRLNKPDDYIQFCVLAFCKKLKKKEIADIMCIDVETVRKYKSIRKKELENL